MENPCRKEMAAGTLPESRTDFPQSVPGVDENSSASLSRTLVGVSADRLEPCHVGFCPRPCGLVGGEEITARAEPVGQEVKRKRGSRAVGGIHQDCARASSCLANALRGGRPFSAVERCTALASTVGREESGRRAPRAQTSRAVFAGDARDLRWQ